MDRSKKLLKNEKGALLCLFLLSGVFTLSALISAKISAGSGILEGMIFSDRSSEFPLCIEDFIRMASIAAVRFAPMGVTTAVVFMLADSSFLFPVSAAISVVRGIILGISVAAITGRSEILQVMFYSCVSLLFLILVSYTVGVRMALPYGVKPYRYLIESYLIFSGLGFIGEFLLPFIL